MSNARIDQKLRARIAGLKLLIGLCLFLDSALIWLYYEYSPDIVLNFTAVDGETRFGIRYLPFGISEWATILSIIGIQVFLFCLWFRTREQTSQIREKIYG